MNLLRGKWHTWAHGCAVVALTLALQSTPDAQAPQRPPAAAPVSAKAAAPFDLTGYWVSIVTQDWRQRMVTPANGDYASVPITAEAKRVADTWDPAKDDAAGEQCRSYGAPAVMRNPGRIHIAWQDDQTLKVETDAGLQTRLFHFGAPKRSRGAATWQGESVAQWEIPATRSNRERKYGSLKVVTTRARPGYLRKNGIPYSADAVLTEYWDLIRTPGGETWITITSVVDDPQYLRTPWVTALHFKKEPDGARWDPSPCSATW